MVGDWMALIAAVTTLITEPKGEMATTERMENDRKDGKGVRTEAATILVVLGGGVFFLFLLLPLLVVLARLPAVFQASHWSGAVLGGVVILTGVFFVLLLGGLLAFIMAGVSAQ